jgi:uncharacterized protein (DUF58 family)
MEPDLNFSKNPARPNGPSFAPSGYLFHNGSLLAAGGLLLLSAWQGLITLVVPLGVVLAAALLCKAFARLSLVQVSGRRTLKDNRLFPGDRTELRLELVNRKILPLPWVEIEETLPPQLTAGKLPPSQRRPGFGSLVRSSSLLWYRRVKWKIPLQAEKRGYYPLGPLCLASGDPFGFYRRTVELPEPEFVLVYPRILPLPDFAPPSLFPLGDIRSEKRIFQDPVRPVGLRDYQPADSLRHIHWKASVRSPSLQVKIFEPSVTLQAALFFGADTYRENGALREEDFEWGLSLAASLALRFSARGIPTGLYSNGRAIDTGQPVQVLPGGSREQIPAILEALAKLTPQTEEPLESFWQKERRALARGATPVFVVHRISEPLAWHLRDLKIAGYKPAAVISGEQETGGIAGVEIRKWPRSRPAPAPAGPGSAP